MSLKMYFLHSRLDFFPENYETLSKEHGEHVQHDSSAMGKRYRGKWNSSMLADCCWIVTGDSPVLVYKWQVKSGTFNQGKPVSIHYIMDVVCKASVT
jgi:hypothetical protein